MQIPHRSGSHDHAASFDRRHRSSPDDLRSAKERREAAFYELIHTYRWVYSSDLPQQRVKRDDEQKRGVRFKCRSNVMQEIAGRIELGIMQRIITDPKLVKECYVFIDQITQGRNNTHATTQEEIDQINGILDQILDSVNARKQGISSPKDARTIDQRDGAVS